MSKQSNTKQSSTLGPIFGWGGAILGFLAGTNTGEIGPALGAALILGITGFIVGRFVEWAVAQVLFVCLLVVLFLLSPFGRLSIAVIKGFLDADAGA